MRTHVLLAALITLLTPAAADARLFWQTYGATVAVDGGCAWNLNQDYFVPRYCDSGRYGLFSACKTSHARSAACKNLHPIYRGYCTPYSSCRYKWRDHVYQTYCGCTPLSHKYGPWHLEKCSKHPLVLRHSGPGCAGTCGIIADMGMSGVAFGTAERHDLWLCNVEPLGGEMLGSIPAIATGSAGGGGAAAMATSTPAAPSAQLPPKLNLAPPSASAGGIPAPFNY
jgi:hypothetical protein